MTHIHLIGIGGSGLSAIARFLLESGYSVSGSDQQFSPLAVQIQAAGARVFTGHQAENLAGADLVVRSSAIPDDNVEVKAAMAIGIPVLKRSDFIGQLMENRLGIAIAGTHGKTTTTAMISWMLTALDQDPSYIIGGIARNLGTNAHAGRGAAFVIEADEYDYMFLGLRPTIAIVTNVEHDHPDCFPTPHDFYQAFVEFVKRLTPQGMLLACVDDPGAARLLDESLDGERRVFAYGLSRQIGLDVPEYAGSELEPNERGGLNFMAIHGETPLVRVSLQVPGAHNVRNALAALAVAHLMDLSLMDAADALGAFLGTGRRFEVRGESGEIMVIDDYAHHPTEIRATLAATKERYPGRPLWAVWQPHTYSRTRLFFSEFASAFNDADHVLVTEVYSAREAFDPEFSADQVVQNMLHPDKHFIANLAQVPSFLVSHLHSGDVVIVLSAGDADRISTEVLNALHKEADKHAQS